VIESGWATRAFGIASAFAGILATPQPAWSGGNPARGADLFVHECALCHSIDKNAPNRFGPNLFGIADRKAGTAEGYRYSPAFKALANWTWSPDGIASFIRAPAATIPGNRMSVFQGVPDKDLDDIIAYLAMQK
jgi:cytochrome c2